MSITSPQNERVKLVRALQSQGKVRRKEGRIVLEGVRLIVDALEAGNQPDFAFYTADAVAPGKPGAGLFAALNRRGVPCLEVTPAVMAHAAETQTPQGIIAVLPIPTLELPSAITLALILDGVSEPGNMGTILRSAAATGTDVVVLAPGCVDPYNPKALRSGMGAHFRIPVIHKNWEEIAAEYSHLALYLADAAGTHPYYAVNWGNPCGLIIGGEAHGANTPARRLAHVTVSIPMANNAESLNAAVAAAVILFEMRRQRTA